MKHAPSIFRAVLCLSTAVMMMISWPLWVTGGEFPRVPWIGGWPLLPGWASWIRFVVTLISMLITAVPSTWKVADESPALTNTWRERLTLRRITDAALIVSLVLSAWMVLEDQFRLQPWMYQFLLMGLALAACTSGRAWTLCRVFVIALYLYSALSKLDHEFVEGTGRWFLFYGAKALGYPLKSWTGPVYRAIIVTMPCVEIAIAGSLTFRLRKIGVAAAVLLHMLLIAILGPRGANHSANVLIWNASMAVEVVMLFLGRSDMGRGSSSDTSHPAPTDSSTRQSLWPRLTSVIATGLMIVAATMPLFERQGYWDTWPSFALYAGSDEKIYISLSGEPGEFPLPLENWSHSAYRGYSIGVGLKAWCLRDRRVPLYPSARALNGVAEAVASRYRYERVTTVTHDGKADRRTGKRERQTFVGLDAIRRHGDSFWLNAHPAR